MIRNLTACGDSPCPVLDPFGKTSSATEVFVKQSICKAKPCVFFTGKKRYDYFVHDFAWHFFVHGSSSCVVIIKAQFPVKIFATNNGFSKCNWSFTNRGKMR